LSFGAGLNPILTVARGGMPFLSNIVYSSRQSPRSFTASEWNCTLGVIMKRHADKTGACQRQGQTEKMSARCHGPLRHASILR
jgi:hypothetical protein